MIVASPDLHNPTITNPFERASLWIASLFHHLENMTDFCRRILNNPHWVRIQEPGILSLAQPRLGLWARDGGVGGRLLRGCLLHLLFVVVVA